MSQLKPLLDKDLYDNFAEKIKHRKEVHESIIVSIVSQKDFRNKASKKTQCLLQYISFQSKINFVKNNEGDIISGSTSTINKVEDVWQFQKKNC